MQSIVIGEARNSLFIWFCSKVVKNIEAINNIVTGHVRWHNILITKHRNPAYPSRSARPPSLLYSQLSAIFLFSRSSRPLSLLAKAPPPPFLIVEKIMIHPLLHIHPPLSKILCSSPSFLNFSPETYSRPNPF